jgi:hypothetical protein
MPLNKLVEIAMGSGGRCEIRTHERVAALPVFKTGALNRSANLPSSCHYNAAGFGAP